MTKKRPCSPHAQSLVAIVEDHGSRVVQFSHFSIQQFLMSDRLATSSGDLSRHHFIPEVAHTILAQACLGSLLYLGDRMDDESVKDLSLAEYAAEHWVTRAQFHGVASRVADGMVSLFDPDEPYLAAWVGRYNVDGPYQTYRGSFSMPTPLYYYSSLCGFSDLVQYLIVRHPHHVNAMGGRYESPLLAALVRKHVGVAEILHQNGANLDIRGMRNRTPLHVAIRNSDTDIVRFLLQHGADVNAQQDDLSTPLHLAMRNSQGLGVDIAELLLKYGADPHARDKDYATPWLLARYRERFDIARVLLYHDAKAPTENDPQGS
jgi:hypothetical protein